MVNSNGLMGRRSNQTVYINFGSGKSEWKCVFIHNSRTKQLIKKTDQKIGHFTFMCVISSRLNSETGQLKASTNNLNNTKNVKLFFFFLPHSLR